MAQRLKRLPAMRETWVRSLGREDPLEKEMVTHSSILAWRTPWTEEPRLTVHGVAKSRTQLSDFTSLNPITGFSRWLGGTESTCNAKDSSLIPGLGRSPGGGQGNPLQHSCLENPMDRGAWQGYSP